MEPLLHTECLHVLLYPYVKENVTEGVPVPFEPACKARDGAVRLFVKPS